MFSYAVPPVVAIFLMGVFWRRATSAAALATLIFGHALGVAAFLVKQAGGLPWHFTIVAGVTALLCSAFCALVSLLTTPRDVESIAPALWNPQRVAPDREHPWYADYRVQVSAVAGLTLFMVVVFW